MGTGGEVVVVVECTRVVEGDGGDGGFGCLVLCFLVLRFALPNTYLLVFVFL